MRGKRNKIVWIEAEKLKIHPTAQRMIAKTKLRTMTAGLDLDLIGSFVVVESDGDLYVVDGQHRKIALERNGLGELPVPCLVHDNLSDANASKLFLGYNDRAVVPTFDKFENLVQSGDPVACGAKEIVERYGFIVSRSAKEDGNVACVKALQRSYVYDQGSTLAEVFEVASAAWGKRSDATTGAIVEGLTIVLSSFNGDIDRPRLVKQLAKYPGGAAGVIGDARGLAKIRRGSMSRAIAETILDAYNRGLRDSNRLELKAR